jgi:hypothetical protein
MVPFMLDQIFQDKPKLALAPPQLVTDDTSPRVLTHACRAQCAGFASQDALEALSRHVDAAVADKNNNNADDVGGALFWTFSESAAERVRVEISLLYGGPIPQEMMRDSSDVRDVHTQGIGTCAFFDVGHLLHDNRLPMLATCIDECLANFDEVCAIVSVQATFPCPGIFLRVSEPSEDWQDVNQRQPTMCALLFLIDVVGAYTAQVVRNSVRAQWSKEFASNILHVCYDTPQVRQFHATQMVAHGMWEKMFNNDDHHGDYYYDDYGPSYSATSPTAAENTTTNGSHYEDYGPSYSATSPTADLTAPNKRQRRM